MSTLTLGDFIVRLRFDSVSKIGKFDCILDEENRDIVAHKIPIPFISVELNRETANIPNSVLWDIRYQKCAYICIFTLTALPRDPWTVLNLIKIGVVRDGSVRTGAQVHFAAELLKTRN